MKIYHTTSGDYQTNAYFLCADRNDAKEVWVVDPGDDRERIFTAVEQTGRKLSRVLVTHGHFDHLASARALCEAYGAALYFPEKEIPYVEEKRYALMQETAPVLDDFLSYVRQNRGNASRVVLVKDGDHIQGEVADLEVLETAGHTDHSVCYYAPAEKVLFGGDTLFAFSVGRTDMYGGDLGDLARNIKERLLTLPEDTLVLPGHGGPTTIGREKEYNPYLA